MIVNWHFYTFTELLNLRFKFVNRQLKIYKINPRIKIFTLNLILDNVIISEYNHNLFKCIIDSVLRFLLNKKKKKKLISILNKIDSKIKI